MAAGFLIKNGYRIVCKNYYLRSGEIDIIAKENRTIVFVEVKYRKDRKKGSPLEAVGYTKQRKILKTALFYLAVSGSDTSVPCRFDVIGIDDAGNVAHIRNAFGFEPGDSVL